VGSLDGKVALVTGAARGQGRSHVLALAAEGADIVAWDVPSAMSSPTYPLGTQEDLDLTAKLVSEMGRRCVAMSVDVRDSAQVNAGTARALDEFGRLDIALANAGIVSLGPLAEVTDETWAELVATNLTGHPALILPNGFRGEDAPRGRGEQDAARRQGDRRPPCARRRHPMSPLVMAGTAVERLIEREAK